MSRLTLSNTRLHEGVWHGVLVAPVASDEPPLIEVVHQDTVLDGVEILPDPEMRTLWTLRVPVPPALLCDGIQTFVVRDMVSDENLASFSIVAGQPLEEDLRVELDLLRAELDLLKKAFRRHCADG